MSQRTDTRAMVPPAMALRAANTMMRKPTPAKARPSANFVGLDGSLPRLPSDVHTIAISGANSTTKNGSADCIHVAGTTQPRIVRSVKSRENRLSDVGACSKADQKIIE